MYIVPNTFSLNLMIVIIDTFRNSSNSLKLYEITLFPQVQQIIILFMKVMSCHYTDDSQTSNACNQLNFRCRDMKFSDMVQNTITIINKN